MAFAIVHFTVGFVFVLLLLLLAPITRYRLTVSFFGGLWALAPDIHHFFPGHLSDIAYGLHNDPLSNIFFFHHYLDKMFFRNHNFEFTFVSLFLLGVTFLIYDWRFGQLQRTEQIIESTDTTEDST